MVPDHRPACSLTEFDGLRRHAALIPDLWGSLVEQPARVMFADHRGHEGASRPLSSPFHVDPHGPAGCGSSCAVASALSVVLQMGEVKE